MMAEAALDALAAAGCTAADRPLLTHCQILGADLVARMAASGVVANIQPSFTLTDAAFARARLPAGLQAYAYIWKGLLAAGVRCAGGSDAPVETPNPLRGMHG
jgi:predicted amidohydrolase YtcJ